MASLETTELKLKTTPTGGVEASHSPYYRRLLSAGYKGFLQGSIGGAGLYGAYGLAVGTLCAAVAAFAVPAAGLMAFTLVPLFGGLGAIKGATTFGNIGSIAAINAESADLSEQRRYLLDRYYDIPEGPDGDREAAAIKQELINRQLDSKKAPPFFHWKTLLIGATIGAVIGLAVFSPMGISMLGLGEPIAHALQALKLGGLIETLTTMAGSSIGTATTEVVKSLTLTSAGTILGGVAGTLTGATIGIDRYYIRKWFDHTEGVVHGSSHQESALMERSQQIQRLKEAAQEDNKTREQMSAAGNEIPALLQRAADAGKQAPFATQNVSSPLSERITHTAKTEPVASLDQAYQAERPTTTIRQATLQNRLVDIQHAVAAL